MGDAAGDAIRVAVRLRPDGIGHDFGTVRKEIWCKLGTDQVARKNQKNEVLEHQTYEVVFDGLDSNDVIFNSEVRELVGQTVLGFNVTIMAYGQSGSGKTHTLTGSGNEEGLVQLAIQHVFESIGKSKETSYLLRLSYLEIYNERVLDLLAGAQMDLAVRDAPDGSTVIDGLKEAAVSSMDDAMQLLDKAQENRKVGETNVNDRSSRSHTITRLTIETRKKTGKGTISQLNLVDLAGSENAAQTGAVGQRQKEGANINKSLLALSKVIQQLSTNQKFVTFRESRLTRILKSSLGGNSRTLMLCTIASAASPETASTLKFAQNAKNVKNKPVRNVTAEGGKLAECLEEIEELKKRLEEKDLAEREQHRAKLEELMRTVLSGNNVSTAAKQARNRRQTWAPGVDGIGGLAAAKKMLLGLASPPRFAAPPAPIGEEEEEKMDVAESSSSSSDGTPSAVTPAVDSFDPADHSFDAAEVESGVGTSRPESRQSAVYLQSTASADTHTQTDECGEETVAELEMTRRLMAETQEALAGATKELASGQEQRKGLEKLLDEERQKVEGVLAEKSDIERKLQESQALLECAADARAQHTKLVEKLATTGAALTETREKLESVEERAEAAETRATHAEGTLRETSDKAHADMAAWHAKETAMKAEMEELQKRAEKETSELQLRVQQLMAECEQVKSSLSASSDDRECALRARVSEMESRLAAETRRADHAHAKLASLRADVVEEMEAKVRSKMEEDAATMADLRRRLRDTEARMAVLCEEADSQSGAAAERELSELRDEHSRAQAALADAESRVAKLRVEVQAMNEQIERMRHINQTTKDKLAAATTARDLALQQARESREEVAAAQARVKELEAMCTAGEQREKEQAGRVEEMEQRLAEIEKTQKKEKEANRLQSASYNEIVEQKTMLEIEIGKLKADLSAAGTNQRRLEAMHKQHLSDLCARDKKMSDEVSKLRAELSTATEQLAVRPSPEALAHMEIDMDRLKLKMKDLSESVRKAESEKAAAERALHRAEEDARHERDQNRHRQNEREKDHCRELASLREDAARWKLEAERASMRVGGASLGVASLGGSSSAELAAVEARAAAAEAEVARLKGLETEGHAILKRVRGEREKLKERLALVEKQNGLANRVKELEEEKTRGIAVLTRVRGEREALREEKRGIEEQLAEKEKQRKLAVDELEQDRLQHQMKAEQRETQLLQKLVQWEHRAREAEQQVASQSEEVDCLRARNFDLAARLRKRDAPDSPSKTALANRENREWTQTVPEKVPVKVRATEMEQPVEQENKAVEQPTEKPDCTQQ